jgi:hypothetical protein
MRIAMRSILSGLLRFDKQWIPATSGHARAANGDATIRGVRLRKGPSVPILTEDRDFPRKSVF